MKRQVPEGAKVKFHHTRRYDKESNLVVEPRGGSTQCVITFPDGGQVLGVARCSSKDNYNKRLGREISLGRALASLEAVAHAQEVSVEQ